MLHARAIARPLVVSALMSISTITPVNGAPQTDPVVRDDAGPPIVAITAVDDDRIELTVQLDGIRAQQVDTKAGAFVALTWPGAAPWGDVGTPLLPVYRQLFTAPVGADVNLNITSGPSHIISLPPLGYADPIVPMQPRIEMTPSAIENIPFRWDRASYAHDAFTLAQRAGITKAGIARGRQLYLLEVRPVAYNPARGQLNVWQDIDIRITITGGARSAARIGPAAPLDALLLNPEPLLGSGRGTGNYLIVVADDLADTILPFTAAKTAQGFDVTTQVVASGSSAASIKADIESLWGTADAPDYLLLVGDSNTIPSWVGGGARHTSTDLPYACMDGGDDWYPDMAYARFSVRKQDQLQAIIDKTLFMEAGVFADPTAVKRVVFLAGWDAPANGEPTHDWVIDTYLGPRDYDSRKLYTRIYAARTQDVYDEFNAGCVIGVFHGHSWWDQWQSGPVFSHIDVQNLSNEGMYPFVLNMTCSIGNYANSTYEPCFTEEWLRVPDKGAAAVVGATAYIYYQSNPGWPETCNLEKYVFDTIYLDGIYEVSPIWQGALGRLLTMYGPGDPVCRDYFEMFALLGDPSLEIPMDLSSGFALTVSPDYRDLCAPADATHTLDIHEILGYSEEVTLSAAGAPAGTTVDFSINPVVPGGSSVMTIGNTGAAVPGEYLIEVTAESIDMSRTVVVDLDISASAPDAPTPTGPTEGATDQDLVPTLVWDAPPQAGLQYEVGLGVEGSGTSYYHGRIPEASHTISFHTLSPNTEYWWHVKAYNGCGYSGWSTMAHFTTGARPTRFTEQFSGDFDLDGMTIRFIPEDSVHHYEMCSLAAAALPTDPAGGTTLTLDDDDSTLVTPGSSVSLYGESYDSFHINSNGSITFTGIDATYQESVQVHFVAARVAGLFDDLDPASAGSVSWKELADRVAVTWQNVPEYGQVNSNTFQIELFFDGEIHITWLGIASTDGIAGLSPGNGLPDGYLETNLSAASTCPDDPCPGDLDGDGDVDQADLGILLAAYGLNGTGDCDGDGDTDQADLGILLANYGTVCP
ncbi:MAG: hypothetical protein KAS72_05435 [Phycisphaerales bacterium]|nr:hypothetical protein [Phycisphaerales bacterium]